jgi:hypothetical protein
MQTPTKGYENATSIYDFFEKPYLVSLTKNGPNEKNYTYVCKVCKANGVRSASGEPITQNAYLTVSSNLNKHMEGKHTAEYKKWTDSRPGSAKQAASKKRKIDFISDLDSPAKTHILNAAITNSPKYSYNSVVQEYR